MQGLRELFHSIDADGSGTITVNELKEALKAKGQQIPEADIQNLVGKGGWEEGLHRRAQICEHAMTCTGPVMRVTLSGGQV
jgi:hypothetical protein